jgi:hypothetical protein
MSGLVAFSMQLLIDLSKSDGGKATTAAALRSFLLYWISFMPMRLIKYITK